MTLNDVRTKYIEFFKKNGHTAIPSARLVPDNDPTTLFTGSGMQPLVPYLLGQKHPQGGKLVNSQKCFRSGDIDDIGDNRHTTFFEMLGNWSLGTYFKDEQLPWVFEFLTKEIGIDPHKIYVTTFIGDEANKIPKDTDAAELWKKLFKQHGIEVAAAEMGSEADAAHRGMKEGERIFYYDAKKNWWSRSGVPSNMPAGEPGGPDSEIFYEFTDIKHDVKFGKHCHPNCDCGRFLEIGNSVFMEYKKEADGSFSKLPQRNVDFGGGLERVAAVSENHADVFKIDVFSNLISTLEKLSGKKYDNTAHTQSFRIIADHLRASVFLIGDGIAPSNTDQGYFVRRLIRRAVRYWDGLGITEGGLYLSVEPLVEYYRASYPETYAQKQNIVDEIKAEEERFRHTLKTGLREFEKISASSPSGISGKDAFVLFSTYGFPLEITTELAKEKGITVDVDSFKQEFKKHQDASRAGSEQKFKGGLADTSEKSVQYHTATHLLHKALREVLGSHVEQRGSNITPERLRFDFSHPQKMTDEEKKRVEDLVNEKIQAGLDVKQSVLPKDDALKTGALHFFGEKYGDEVSVYYIGDSIDTAFSKEFCGGPHIHNTKELGKFKIAKEEAAAAGIRRIKAVLE